MENHNNHAPIPPSWAELQAHRVPLRNAQEEQRASFTRLEQIAVTISRRVGTPGFFMLIIAWTIFWLGWNTVGPPQFRFDPPMGFVLWLFISNMIQIFLMPLLLVASNLENRYADRRASSDYDVNVRAEREIEAVLRHLEHQNAMLAALLDHHGVEWRHHVHQPASTTVQNGDRAM